VVMNRWRSESRQEVLHFASGAPPGKLDEPPLSLGLVASKPTSPLFFAGLWFEALLGLAQ